MVCFVLVSFIKVVKLTEWRSETKPVQLSARRNFSGVSLRWFSGMSNDETRCRTPLAAYMSGCNNVAGPIKVFSGETTTSRLEPCKVVTGLESELTIVLVETGELTVLCRIPRVRPHNAVLSHCMHLQNALDLVVGEFAFQKEAFYGMQNRPRVIDWKKHAEF